MGGKSWLGRHISERCGVGWGTGLHGRFRIENTDEGGQEEGVEERAGLASSLQHRNSELGMQG